MPDEYNRYSLAEMRQYVLRNLASLRVPTVDPQTGQESGTPFEGLNAQFSAQALNIRINSALTKASLLINAENDTIYATEVFYDAVPGALQYPVPPNMLQLRGLWWKDASCPAPAKPDAYRLMSMQDTIDAPHDFMGQVNRPTWRRVGGFFLLNRDPGDFSTAINTGGIWVRFLRWENFLTEDTAYINPPYAQILQEICVYDATLESVRTQDEMVDASGITTSLAYWNQQLEILVRNAYRPPEIRLIGPAHHYLTFSGRRGSHGGGWSRE